MNQSMKINLIGCDTIVNSPSSVYISHKFVDRPPTNRLDRRHLLNYSQKLKNDEIHWNSFHLLLPMDFISYQDWVSVTLNIL